jgi:hypothetical protein
VQIPSADGQRSYLGVVPLMTAKGAGALFGFVVLSHGRFTNRPYTTIWFSIPFFTLGARRGGSRTARSVPFQHLPQLILNAEVVFAFG